MRRWGLYVAAAAAISASVAHSAPPRTDYPLDGGVSRRPAWGGFRWGAMAVATAHAEDGSGSGSGSGSGLMAQIASWFEDRTRGLLNDPSGRKLLPDAPRPGEPGFRKYTLVISDDLLLATVYAPTAGGLLTRKRPAAEWFLTTLAQFYEVVIFSTSAFADRDPLINKLDPRRAAAHRLYRDSAVSVGVGVQKDLSLLNRDLANVILLDSELEHSVQPENTVAVPAYSGKDSDQTLQRLLPFLIAAALLRQGDVRASILEFKATPEAFDAEFARWKQAQQKRRR